MDDTGRGANVHGEILCGDNYYIRIKNNEKLLMKLVMGRMCMTKYRMEKLIIKYKD
ncbi:hypothetical protein [Prevotella histicola]